MEQDLFMCGIYISPNTNTSRRNVDESIFDKLGSDVLRFSRLGEVMIMGALNAYIDSKDFDFIQNETSDNLDDFVPDNHAIYRQYT